MYLSGNIRILVQNCAGGKGEKHDKHEQDYIRVLGQMTGPMRGEYHGFLPFELAQVLEQVFGCRRYIEYQSLNHA